MGFYGKTYNIPCDKGGLFDHPNIDLVSPQAMIFPSRNINLHLGGRGKRGGTTHVNESALTGTPAITGIYDFIQSNMTQFVVLSTSDGKVWKDTSTTIKTGLMEGLFPSFETFNDCLYMCNGMDTPAYWDGSSASMTDMTSIPTSWSGNMPFQFVKHGYGVSERLWAVTKDSIWGSKNSDATDFSDDDVIQIPITTPEGGGLTAIAEFGDRLFIFGRRSLYILDDSLSDVSGWGYQQAQFNGGVANWRLVCKTPTDLVCMMEDGDIYSMKAGQNYGDYQWASIARPAFMHKWIQDNVNLSQISKFHMVFDPILRAIKIFVVQSGQTNVNMCLLYFIDRDPAEAWMVHDNQNYASGYNACSSAIVRYATGNYRNYTGDYSGFIWRLECPDRNDNGNPYYAGFTTPPLNFENPRITKRFVDARIVMNPKGNYNLNIKWWVDGSYKNTSTISMAGTGAILDLFLLDTDYLGGDEVIDGRVPIGEIGKRIKFEIYNNGDDQDFFISQVMIDFVPQGARP